MGRRLAHKQWLIFYPLALAVINVLAFLAVYGAAGGDLGWNAFFATNFDRWQFIRDHFISDFSLTPALGVAVFAGLASCVFAAMLRAPLFRAIVGSGYPLSPRGWDETARLSLFYVLFNLLLVAMPNIAPSGNSLNIVAAWVAFVLMIFLVYTDYIIVFEGLAFLPALRRSARLLSSRWPPVLAVTIVLVLLQTGLGALYSRYYTEEGAIFVLIPLSEILAWAFIGLLWDLFLIFLYDRVRQTVR